jgi:hypothetical protein
MGRSRHSLVSYYVSLKMCLLRVSSTWGNLIQSSMGLTLGPNRPVKQRIRRTPLGFAGEEEAQLKKMLGAGEIRPSVSEWASAPVLIRKRCGSVR